MRYNKLGKTDLKVSELALGGLFVSSVGGEFKQARATINKAIELGINYFDTAPSYYNSEEVLGKALEDIKEPYILSTKLGGKPVPFDPQDKSCLLQSVEDSMKLLKRDYIDILMIHEPDRPGQYNWWTNMEEYYGPVIEALKELKKDGIIKYTGLGGTTAYQLAPIIRTGLFDIVLTAFNYSLLWREAEHEVIPAAKEMETGIIVGSPLQQGALSRRYDEIIRQKPRWLSLPRQQQYLKLYEFLDEIDISLPELAMRFVISNPDIDCVLTGARSPGEVEKNVEAVEKGPLPQEILDKLDKIAAMVPFRPFEEPFGLPFGREYEGPWEAR
jgi:D-threo-aldose 1-dehydrogenase